MVNQGYCLPGLAVKGFVALRHHITALSYSVVYRSMLDLNMSISKECGCKTL